MCSLRKEEVDPRIDWCHEHDEALPSHIVYLEEILEKADKDYGDYIGRMTKVRTK